jgi:predicted nuclease of predicted toxin-antitoxin system
MIKILIDHNIEGQAIMLLGTLTSQGWQELLPIQFVTFANIGLHYESKDREVWRYAQENGMILLTENRNMSGKDSLEQTLREENKIDSSPVLTIANANRIVETDYRERCVTRVAEILFDLENYMGAGRIYIP